MKNGGWLTEEKTFSVSSTKKDQYRRQLSTRASWQYSRTRKLRRLCTCEGVFTWEGECVYRYRFPSGRDNPLMQVQSSASSSSRNGVLLLAYCEKTAFSTLEVTTREGDLNSSPSQQCCRRSWEDIVDAPDASYTKASCCVVCNFARERSDDNNFEKWRVWLNKEASFLVASWWYLWTITL